jgi:hypothetical protein
VLPRFSVGDDEVLKRNHGLGNTSPNLRLGIENARFGNVHFRPQISHLSFHRPITTSLLFYGYSLVHIKPSHLSLSLHRLALTFVHVLYITFPSLLFPISFCFDYICRLLGTLL